MPRKKAIVILVIGEWFQNSWKKHCEPNWRPYAEKWGYDIILIDDFIDSSAASSDKSPTWQKCLIFEHPETQGYDNVVWVDTDIVINFNSAPCIVGSMHDPEALGCVLRSSRASEAFVDNCERRSATYNNSAAIREAGWGEPREKYIRTGLPGDINDRMNTGVLVVNQSHAETLRYVYDTCERTTSAAKRKPPWGATC